MGNAVTPDDLPNTAAKADSDSVFFLVVHPRHTWALYAKHSKNNMPYSTCPATREALLKWACLSNLGQWRFEICCPQQTSWIQKQGLWPNLHLWLQRYFTNGKLSTLETKCPADIHPPVHRAPNRSKSGVLQVHMHTRKKKLCRPCLDCGILLASTRA
jgi:hypothetical protein